MLPSVSTNYHNCEKNIKDCNACAQSKLYNRIIRKLYNNNFSFSRQSFRISHSLDQSNSFSQGIPTLIIAVSGIDDAASVAIHGIIQSIMFFPNAILWYQILQGPIAIVGGLGFGVLWGWLAKYVPEKGDVSNLPSFLIPFPFS